MRTTKIIALSLVGLIAAATGFFGLEDASASDPATLITAGAIGAAEGAPDTGYADASSLDALDAPGIPGASAEAADAIDAAPDFRALDTDDSGTLTREEFRRDGLPEDAFAELDANHDGLVSREELASYSPAAEKPQP